MTEMANFDFRREMSSWHLGEEREDGDDEGGGCKDERGQSDKFRNTRNIVKIVIKWRNYVKLYLYHLVL